MKALVPIAENIHVTYSAVTGFLSYQEARLQVMNSFLIHREDGTRLPCSNEC